MSFQLPKPQIVGGRPDPNAHVKGGSVNADHVDLARIRPVIPPIAQVVQSLPTPNQSVTVIIAARNNAGFLPDAIRSVQSQTVPTKILYVDDGSEDDSPDIAGRLRVTVIRQAHSGVVAARNAGLAAAKTEYVLFLDGDDQLPPHFLQYKLAAMERSGADFIYSPAQCFGDRCFTWEVPDWSVQTLWGEGSYVNTSALYRVRDLKSLGGWRENLAGTAWDWDLALRMARAGKRGEPERGAPLLYRQHAASLSHEEKQHDPHRLGYIVINGLARMAILCIYSGRLPILDRWLAAVSQSVQEWRRRLLAEDPYHGFANPMLPLPELLILATNGGREGVWRAVDQHAHAFGNVSVLCEQWDTGYHDEQDRQHKVCTRLADAYNRLVGVTSAELIWTVEDDVIVPSNAMADLNRALLWDVKYAVSGIYRNRHTPEFIIGSDWPKPPDQSTVVHRRQVNGDEWCDLAGTGCLMFNRILAPHRFEPYCHGIAAHDWNWSLRLRDSTLKRPYRKQVLLVSSVRCRHCKTEKEWV